MGIHSDDDIRVTGKIIRVERGDAYEEREDATFTIRPDSPEDYRRLLVHQVVAAFYRVKGVPLGFVLFDISQGGADAPLGRPGMAADWE